MRGLSAFLLTAVFATFAHGQTLTINQKVAPRYGISASIEFYPQGTAKEALTSAAKALQNKRYEYIVAHLLDPEFVDGKVAEAAALLEPAIEKEFDAKRAEQKKRPERYAATDFLPIEPVAFAERVKAEATLRAYRMVAQRVAETLGESPENTKELNKLASGGTLTETQKAATATHKDLPSKTVFLKLGDARILTDTKNLQGQPIVIEQILPRWYVEDRQQAPLTDK